MKIWIEYQHRFSDGEKGPYRVMFYDNPEHVKLIHGRDPILMVFRTSYNDEFMLKWIDGLIIEAEADSIIEKRMAEHIEREWGKIGK